MKLDEVKPGLGLFWVQGFSLTPCASVDAGLLDFMQICKGETTPTMPNGTFPQI